MTIIHAKVKDASKALEEAAKGPQFSDMFRGDSTANYDRIDISKVQMFFFTIILVAVYGAMIANLLATKGELLRPLGVDMPAFTSSLNVILAISHGGYLAVKQTE